MYQQEGIFTALFGLVTLIIGIPSSPDNFPNNRLIGLTPLERTTYCEALAQDWSGDADTDGLEHEIFSWKEVVSVFTDAAHVWLVCIPLFFNGVTVRL